MGDFGNNFKASEPKKSLNDPNLTNNNYANTYTTIKTRIQAFKINKSVFDKICELCVKIKQTWVVCWYKLKTPNKKKLEEVYINL